VRTLVEDILARYPDVDKKALKKQLGLHSKALVTKKRVGPNKVTVWEVAAEEGPGSPPLFFDASGGHGDPKVFPTVFALWKLPEMVKAVDTWSPVSEKVMQGADLMLPGVIVPAGGLHFEAGDVRAICVQGNPYPMAIGEMFMSSDDARAAGMKGKGVVVFHTYGDTLWELGGKAVPSAQAFQPTRVLALEAPVAPSAQQQEDEEADGGSEEEERDAKSAAPPIAKNLPPKPASSPAASPAAAAAAASSPTSSSFPAWMSDPNELLDRTFVQAIRKVPDEDLPMSNEVFFKSHLLPARPRGTTIEIAKSRCVCVCVRCTDALS
jgi:translation initiation factor 2D